MNDVFIDSFIAKLSVQGSGFVETHGSVVCAVNKNGDFQIGFSEPTPLNRFMNIFRDPENGTFIQVETNAVKTAVSKQFIFQDDKQIFNSDYKASGFVAKIARRVDARIAASLHGHS